MRTKDWDRNAREPSGDRPPASSGLATKLILFVFFSTFATALVISWITIEATAVSLRSTIDRLYPRSLEHAADRIEPWIGAIRCQLEHAKHHASSAREPIASEGREGLDGLVVYDAQGTARSHWGLAPEAARSALSAPSRVAAIRLESGAPALAVATAWQQAGDDRDLVGILSLERLRPILEQELPTDRALLALVDGHGRVVVSAGVGPAGVALDRLALPNSHGALRETEVDGHHVIAAARPVTLLDWHAALVIPFETAYAPVLAVVKRVFAIDLCIILVFSLLAYHVTARIVRPITDLSEAARRLAHDEDIEISETSRDEIGLLRQIFFEMVQKQRQHRAELEEINRLNSRLQQANEVLNQLSITDGLTKLNNHRYFQDFLTREIRRVERTREPLSMLLLDLDDFKRLNDRLGHAAGDEILARIAEILNGAVRGSDLCARYGGEEFVVLAPNTAVRGAYALAEKVRTAIAESSFIVDDSLRPLRVTVSIGVAAFCGNRKLFFQKADQALYRAKAGGKNCVVVHDDDLGEDGEPSEQGGEAVEPA